MRSYLVFVLLLAVKLISRAFYRVRLDWVRDEADPWSDVRVLALLNHTSLFSRSSSGPPRTACCGRSRRTG